MQSTFKVLGLVGRPGTEGTDMAQVTCPKCGGTGTVPFSYKSGVCFDCDGTGVVDADAPTAAAKPSNLKAASLAAQAAIASGDKDSARAALDGLLAFQLGWGNRHYDLQRQLVDIINS